MSCKVRLTTCSWPFGRQADRGERREQREGQKAAVFWPESVRDRMAATEGFPTINVAVSREIAIFLQELTEFARGKSKGLRVKKQLTSTLYGAMMIPFKQQKSTRERSR